MASLPLNILILCTGNSARSILGECLINRLGEGRARADSAGSHPKESPHPLAIALLRESGFDVSKLRSKSWDEFATPDAARIDLVITVCDSAAAETCPIWPGHPLRIHWGLPDPAAATGSQAERRSAFERAYRALEQRVQALLALPLEELEGEALERALVEIGSRAAASA